MKDTDDFLSPLLLEADPVTLTVDGAQQSFNAQQLINPNMTAMLIDEFRFTTGVSTFANAFSYLVARLRFGNSNLTNEFVPVPAFAPCYTQWSGDQTRVWHLARPLYVPPGVQVTAEVGVKLPIRATINTALQWGFTIAGRSIAGGTEVPRQIAVPWACATSCYGTTVPFTSKDNELGNPFDSDFYMRQLIGYNINSLDLGRVTRPNFTIQATYGSGKMLVRDPTPFFALFPPDRPIARMQALLKPKDFLKVVLDLPQPSASFTDLSFTTVGMTGYRMLDTPRGV